MTLFRSFYREPQVVFDSAMTIRWGQHELRFLHNPGKTMDHVSVDVPTADLVCAGDNIVGNIVYLSKADPALIRGAIERMQQLGRGTASRDCKGAESDGGAHRP